MLYRHCYKTKGVRTYNVQCFFCKGNAACSECHKLQFAMDALQAKATLNAVSAVPQLEQADKLLTRLPQAKWAADMNN